MDWRDHRRRLRGTSRTVLIRASNDMHRRPNAAVRDRPTDMHRAAHATTTTRLAISIDARRSGATLGTWGCRGAGVTSALQGIAERRRPPSDCLEYQPIRVLVSVLLMPAAAMRIRISSSFGFISTARTPRAGQAQSLITALGTKRTREKCFCPQGAADQHRLMLHDDKTRLVDFGAALAHQRANRDGRHWPRRSS